MAHNIQVAALSANAAADAIAARCNGGTINVYSGTQPATGDTAVPGGAVLLAVCTFGSPAFGASSGGIATANAIAADADANNSGTATWFRVLTSGAAPVFDGTVGNGLAFDLNVPSTTVVIHQAWGVDSMTIQAPEA